MVLQTPSAPTVIERITTQFTDGIVELVPLVVAAIVFLSLYYLVVRVIRRVLRTALRRIYSEEEELVADLGVTIATVVLWFGGGLALLHIAGMGDIAAGLGTATGFVAGGVALAMKNAISDTVAGVYLLQDPDFNKGDRVTAADVTGTLKDIDLRKTRIRSDDGDLVVLANGKVEERWTNESS